jgi:hypothetical protein
MELSDKISELVAVRKKDQSLDAYVATTGTLTALLGMLMEGAITPKDVMYTLQKEIEYPNDDQIQYYNKIIIET